MGDGSRGSDSVLVDVLGMECVHGYVLGCNDGGKLCLILFFGVVGDGYGMV